MASALMKLRKLDKLNEWKNAEYAFCCNSVTDHGNHLIGYAPRSVAQYLRLHHRMPTLARPRVTVRALASGRRSTFPIAMSLSALPRSSVSTGATMLC
jgi:hypothetical protein